MAKYDPNDQRQSHNHDAPISHEWLLKELCEVLERRDMLPTRLEFYLHAVEPYPVAALKAVMSDLYNQSPMPTKLPSPSELRGLVRQHAPYSAAQVGSQEDERWRRQYDVWKRGGFSDEALEVAFTIRDEELGVGLEGSSGEQHLLCQQPGCIAYIPWPTDRRDAGRMFCPHHQPLQSKPITSAEKQAILARATPQAKAFLRSIDVLARQMGEIPITPEEHAAAEADAVPLRARAFEGKAEGPGVNPSLFLNNRPLAVDLPADYRERREIVAAAGWKFVTAEGVWRRGRYDRDQERWRYGTRAITDEEIDRCLDLTAVAEFARRR